MSFASRLLPLLRCQACGGGFDFAAAKPAGSARAEFGVVTCRCSRYPVVDGIPIIQHSAVGIFEHTTGASQVESVTPPELVRLIEKGQGDAALMLCLMPSRPTRWPGWQGWRTRRDVAKLLARRDAIQLRDALPMYFGMEQLGPDTGDYFEHRFAEPRFLVALALAATLEADEKPVLDVACGLGHLGHYLTNRVRSTPVVGLDMNFSHVWFARHWVAPSAEYVCGNVADGLPFGDDVFSSVVVSDAYHYLPGRIAFLRDVDRVSPGKSLILTRVGNRDVMPNEGSESSLRGYLEEIGSRRVRVLAEEPVVRDYLARRNPLAMPPASPESLERTKWLTFVCDATDAAMARRPDSEPLPHSVGRIGINPIYSLHDVDGATRLDFRFPAAWFAYENHQMLEYLPRRTVLDAADRDVLESARWNDALEHHLRQFVLLGMPERY